MTQTQAPQLAGHVGNVGFGGDPGIGAGLYCELLGRQPERVVAHGVQHIVTGHAFEPGKHVGGYVSQRMPHMKTHPRWIREHVHHKQLRSIHYLIETITEWPHRVWCVEGALFQPCLLPFGLDDSRQIRPVALLGQVIGAGLGVLVGHGGTGYGH